MRGGESVSLLDGWEHGQTGWMNAEEAVGGRTMRWLWSHRPLHKCSEELRQGSSRLLAHTMPWSLGFSLSVPPEQLVFTTDILSYLCLPWTLILHRMQIIKKATLIPFKYTDMGTDGIHPGMVWWPQNYLHRLLG